MAECIAVIPTRFDSVRFPGKVLADATGRPLVQHVYEQAAKATTVGRVIVAGDDDRIAAAVATFGGEYASTRRDHDNGTSRIGEVAATLPETDIIVNVQGDEPEIDPAIIDLAVQTLKDHPECEVSTVAAPFGTDEPASDSNIVKVVVDSTGRALYFSRALIPHHRDPGALNHPPLKHVGLYVYRRAFLQTYATLPPTPLEQTERLEQLRMLEHGYRLAVAVLDGPAGHVGIDTPEQYEAFVRRWKGSHSG